MHVSAIQFPRLSLRSWMTRGLLFSCLLLEIDPSVIGPRKRIPGEYPKRLLAEASRDWDYSAAAVALEDHFDPVVHAEEVRRTFFDEDDEEDRGEAENAEEEAMKTTTERSPNFEGTVSEEHLAILLPHVASAYDFLRIQFGHWLTDEAISDYLATLLEDVNSAQLKVTDASQDESSSDSKDRTARTKWRDLASLTEALEEPYQHLHHIRKEGRCGEPNRKVFRVSHFYPTNQIIYVPSDIVLHRCDLHSGCCDDEGSTCVPAEKKVVRQSFYTASIIPSSPGEEAATSARKVRIDPLQTLTKLYFINHTRCECRAAADALRPQHPAFTATDSHPREPAAAATIATSPCRRCPEPFAVRRINTTCHCDCFDGQTDCLHVKRGRKPLDGAETKCVAKKDCSPPTCGEGQFDVQTGYCPKSHKRHKPKKAAELTQQAPAHSMSTSLSANNNSSLVLSPISSSRFHGSDRLRQQ